jgi:hypothetical protein
MAGHRVIAPLDYLHQRGVNLIIEPISFMMRDIELPMFCREANWGVLYRFIMSLNQPVGGRMLDEAQMIAIPVEGGYTLMVWYFTPSEAVERVIQEQDLLRLRLVKGGETGNN